MKSKFKIIIPKQILSLIVIVVALVLGYTAWVDSDFYLYLLWNIFLAIVPFFISGALLWYVSEKNLQPFFVFICVLLWLLVFPNAPYLVTDIIHLNVNPNIPLWFDFLLLFSSAYIGVYLGIHSLDHMEQIIAKYFSKIKTNILIIISIFISSFGIYLGRFPRWNSWDMIVQPKNVFDDIVDVFQNPGDNQEAYITTAVFFVFLIASYYMWRYAKKNRKK